MTAVVARLREAPARTTPLRLAPALRSHRTEGSSTEVVAKRRRVAVRRRTADVAAHAVLERAARRLRRRRRDHGDGEQGEDVYSNTHVHICASGARSRYRGPHLVKGVAVRRRLLSFHVTGISTG
jgi:hypothetical protein